MKSPIPGPNVLLIGASGSGKTTAIRTLVDLGITPFCVFTEPGFEVLGHIPAEKLHWQYIPPADVDWATMIAMAKSVTTLTHEALTSIKDPNKAKYTQYVDLLTAFNDFKCDRDGKAYGNVCTWGTDRAIVLDSMSGVAIMAMAAAVGGKPTAHPGEWGVAMNTVEKLVQKLCTDTQCTFVMMAHAEREVDEVAGGSKIMASTLGKKLAPKLPRFFSDVILARKDADKFTWTTIEPGADLKNRNLPLQAGMLPSFAPLIANWQKQGGVITPDTK
jgi:hypothetical protein